MHFQSLALTLFPLLSLSHSSPQPPITHYEFIKSAQLLTFTPPPPLLTKRDTLNTESTHDNAQITFRAFNTTFYIHLTPTENVIHPNVQILVYDTPQPRTIKSPVTLYKGILLPHTTTTTHLHNTIHGYHQFTPISLGTASITLHSTGNPTLHSNPLVNAYSNPHISGIVEMENGIVYHLNTVHHYNASKREDDPILPPPSDRSVEEMESHVIVYANSDYKSTRDKSDKNKSSGRCGTQDLKFNKDMFNDSIIQSTRILHKRSNGCPTDKRIAYMGVVADCTYVKAYGSVERAVAHIFNNWNMASLVYDTTFNIQLGIIRLEVYTTCDQKNGKEWNKECLIDYPIQSRLSDFSRYRGSKGEDGAALWHLMTKCSTGATVGVGWVRMLCNTKATAQTVDGSIQVISGTAVSSVTKEEWKVVAHEIGHNFGAMHDCTANECPCTGRECNGCCPCSGCDCGREYLMNPTSDVITNTFSPCTVDTICNNYAAIGTCLVLPNTRNVLSASQCGNGVKEFGEECDCGDAEQCANDKCCSVGCKLKVGAQCSDVNDPCCSMCKLSVRGTVCRPKISNCDYDEVCSGESGDCPVDVWVGNGSPCENGAYCASGLCTSRDLQCSIRGQSSGLVKECSRVKGSSSCDMVCESGSGCVKLNGYYVDGTKCGVSGECSRGECEDSSILGATKKFFEENMVAGVCIVVGVSLVVVGGICCCCCCWRKKKRKGVSFKSHKVLQPVQHPVMRYK